jgi:hypothetical protein
MQLPMAIFRDSTKQCRCQDKQQDAERQTGTSIAAKLPQAEIKLKASSISN